MLFKIVGEIARAGAFVTCHMKVIASECPIGEMNSGVGAVHPCPMEPAAPQSNGSLALPTLRLAISATNFEPDRRRTLPLPFSQKFVQLRGNKQANYIRRYCALNVQSKVGRRIEEIRPELTRLMAHAQIPNQCALAVPGKIGVEIGELRPFVRELPKSGVPDDFWTKSIRSEIKRAGDLVFGRRVKFRAGQRCAQAESIKERLQIQAAARFEICSVGSPIPISASGKTALAVVPFAVCDVQVPIIPFRSSRQISHLVASTSQSVPVQRRLYSRLFDFGDVSAEF